MANKRNILVCGGGGFIAGHLAKDLKEQGHNVRVVDKKPLNQWYQPVEGTEQLVLDLELRENCMKAAEGMDMVYNLACNMGGMGFIENNHALCMPVSYTHLRAHET